MIRRPRLTALVFGLAASAYVLDRVTKVLVEDHLAGRPPIVLVPHVVRLAYTTNSGGAFSLLTNVPWLFFGASVVVAAAIVVYAFRVTVATTAVGLGLILGGALGNLTDRVVRGNGISGRVVDFIDFHIWPVFNVADSCIVIGAAVLLVAGLVQGRDRGRRVTGVPRR